MEQHHPKSLPESPPEDVLPLRPCVGIMLVNRDGLVWVGRRLPKRSGSAPEKLWQMPQGGINEGELPEVAARRELGEETGVKSIVLLDEMKDWLSYEFPPSLVGQVLKGRYRGQTQKWYAMRFLGEDNEIDISPDYGETPEFYDWRWVPVTTLCDLVVPFKRDIYKRIVEEFSYFCGS